MRTLLLILFFIALYNVYPEEYHKHYKFKSIISIIASILLGVALLIIDGFIKFN